MTLTTTRNNGYLSNPLIIFDDDLLGLNSSFFTDSSPTGTIKEEKDKWLLAVDLPGVKKEDLTLTTHKQVLHLKWSRKGAKHAVKYTLPLNSSEKAVEASLENGVLEVQIPKLNKDADERTIKIK